MILPAITFKERVGDPRSPHFFQRVDFLATPEFTIELEAGVVTMSCLRSGRKVHVHGIGFYVPVQAVAQEQGQTVDSKPEVSTSVPLRQYTPWESRELEEGRTIQVPPVTQGQAHPREKRKPGRPRKDESDV